MRKKVFVFVEPDFEKEAEAIAELYAETEADMIICDSLTHLQAECAFYASKEFSWEYGIVVITDREIPQIKSLRVKVVNLSRAVKPVWLAVH
ncbi:MAG: hypothetical protein V1891_02105 [bacterium]